MARRGNLFAHAASSSDARACYQQKKEAIFMNLSFHLPTQIHLEEHAVRNHPEAFRLGRHALLVTGRSSAKKNGSQDNVLAVLQEAGIEASLFDEVASNPDIPTCYRGAEYAKKVGADFIIAIGGGSPMDAGKTIALLAAAPRARGDLFCAPYEAALPIVAIPTTSGTGSEVTPYAILSDDEERTKRSIASPLLFPRTALLDPRYQVQLPRRATVNTALDALSHNVESMLSKRRTPLSSAIAASGVQAFQAACPHLIEDCLTREDRASLLYASLVGGIAIAQTATNIVHALGYSLTYFRHIDHGRANALTLGAYLRFLERRCPGATAPVAAAADLPLGKLAGEVAALLGTREEFTPEELRSYVPYARASANSHGAIVDPSEAELLALYEKSLL